MKTRTLIFLSLISFFSFFFLAATPVFGSTLTSDVPWGARNSYWANDGSGNFDKAYFSVGFPGFGPTVDIYTGTGGTATSGSGSYPKDPAAYFNGFTQGQPVTSTVTLTNNTDTRGADTFWFSAGKVDSCAGFDLNTALTEKNLSDCSNASIVSGIMTNQTTLLNTYTSRTYVTIEAKQSHTLTYTWTPLEPGYYQFDFGSDDYAAGANCAINGLDCGPPVSGTASNTFAAGFIRIMPPVAGRVTDSTTGAGISGATISVYNDTNGKQTQTAITDANGNWSINNFVRGGDAYAVSINSVPAGYQLPAKTTTSNYVSNGCISKDQPLNSSSYECQTAGNLDCAGGDLGASYGTFGRCNFSLAPNASTPTPSPAPPAPSNISLQVGNAGGQAQVIPSTFTGGTLTAGLQDPQGSNWLNPLSITINAKGSDNVINSSLITDYYVAFYNKVCGLANCLASETSTNSFLTNIQGRLNTNPKNGFLLRYSTTGPKWYVWNAGIFQEITSTIHPTRINDYSTPPVPILRFYQNGARSWKIDLLEAFGSKSLYTGASVFESATQNYTQAEITPTQTP